MSAKIPTELLSYNSPSMAKKLLSYDAISDAEQRTGVSYKDDERVTAIGLHLMQDNNAATDAILKMNGDTTFCMTTAEYIRVIESIGFRRLLCEGFNDKDGHCEEFFIYWLEPCILLRFDTYHGDRNSGDFYYAWKPNREAYEKRWDFTSSGGMDDKGIWTGHHDCREGIKLNLYRLFTNGTFVAPWPKTPFLWLLSHGDDPKNYKAINAARIAKLPKEIQTVIGAS